MKKSIPAPFLFLVLMILFFSCKPIGGLYKYPYYYTVVNSTDKEIKIYYKTWSYYGYDYGYKQYPDTITFILPGQEKILIAYENSHFRNPEYNSRISTLDTLQAYINDTVPSSVDLMETRYWHYTEIADDAAKLILYVVPEDFKK